MAQYTNETGSVNFRLKEPKAEISRIMGRYSFKGLQADFSTGLKAIPSSWDSDTKTVTSGTNKREINQNSVNSKLPLWMLTKISMSITTVCLQKKN